MKTAQDSAAKEPESNLDNKQQQQTNKLVNLQASEVDGYTDEGLAGLNLLAPGEVITKEQNNTSRQISYLTRLLSQRNSLGKARKYPILGTDREQQVKDAMNKIAVESALAQKLPKPIRHTVARGPNLDIYSTFASRDQSIGTLQPNSPAAFLEPRHIQNMAGTGGSKKNQQMHRRGGSVARGTSQFQKQMYAHHPLAVPTSQQAYVSAQAPGPQSHGQSMQPSHPHQIPSVPVDPREGANSPAEQIHKLHEQSMATLGEQMSIPQPPQYSSAFTNNNDVSIYNHMLQNQRSQADQAARGTFLNASSNQGNGSTRLVRYNQLNKGVGDSEFGSPLGTNSGNVKYAGQRTIQEIVDQDIVDMNNMSQQKFRGSMGIEIDGSFQYVNAAHQPEQSAPRENKPDHATKDDSPVRTQSLFNLNHVSSLHIQPSTAAKQNKQDQLESWTKSSVVDQRRGERNQTLNQQRTLPGNLHMNLQSDMEHSFSSNQLPVGLSDMVGPPYPHYAMHAQSIQQQYQHAPQSQFWQVPQNQSMLLAGRSKHAAGLAAMHVRLEKQEIDKLLKRVRERKRASLAPDPNIKLDAGYLHQRKWSVHQQFVSPQQQFLFAQQESNFISKNPIVIKGIKRRQKSVVPNSDLLGLQVHPSNAQIQQADTLYAGDVRLGPSLNVTDSNHKIIIQDRPSQQDRTGGLPAIEPTQQKANSTAESANNEGLYQNLFGPGNAPEPMQKFIEATGDQYTADEAKSEVLKFQFGGPKNAVDSDHQNRLVGLSRQQDGTSTAAGHSLQQNPQHVSAQALNSEYLQHNLLQFQSPIVDTMPGARSDVKLNQQTSQYSLALDHHAEGAKTVKGNMSLPKIKEVKVSPNLRVGGMSARQRSIMLSQKRLAKIQLSRAQTKLQQQRFHTIDNISVQSHYPNAQSLTSLYQQQVPGVVDQYLPFYASPSFPEEFGYTQPASQASLHAQSQQPQSTDNFFQAIEQLPHLPLSLKLQAKSLIHNLQKQIRLKRQAVDGQKQSNQESLKAYHNLQETKKKLKRAAREVVVYQKKMELDEERRRKQQLESDPDIDQKRQLEREMQELQRQIELNENKIKQEKLDTGMDEQFVDVDLELLEQSNTNADVKQPSKDDAAPKNFDSLDNAQQTVLNIDGDAQIQQEVQNYSVDQNQQNRDMDGQGEEQNSPNAKTEQTPPKLGKIQSAEQQFSPIQQEEILEAPEEDEQQTVKKVNSPTYGDDTEEQSPVMMHQELIDRKAEEMRLKPAKTEKQLQQQAHNAEIETRIYKLYRDYTQNDLKREKKNAFMALRNMKMQGLAYQNELHVLQIQNQHLKKTILRYKNMTENFEAEHETLQRFLIEQKQQKSANKKKKEFNNMKKKINTKQRLREFDAGGTTSPQVDLGRLQQLIPDFDKIGQEDKEGRPTTKKSRDESPTAEKEEKYKGGTLPKTNLKVFKPTGALAGMDFSMVSERPDATTISIGSISARGDVEKVKVQNLEKILHQFKLASRIEKPMDLVLHLIDQVKLLFGCTKVTFMPVDFYTASLVTTNLSREKRNYLRVVTMKDESDNSQQSITAVSRTQEELCDKVLFKSLKNLTSDIKLAGSGTQFAILIRQSTSGGKVKASSLPTPKDQEENPNNESIQSPLEIIKKHEPAFIIQGEIAQPNQNASPKKGGKSKQVEQKPPTIKLSYTTLTVLQMLCMGTQLQFERLRLNQMIRSKGQSEIDELIKMVGRVYKHQNLRALMSGLFTEISTFFNFQDIAIMFHDQEKNQLYTITYGDKEEKELRQKQLLANAKSAEEKAVINAKEAMNDLTLPANQLIYFPISVGISSMVFKQQRAIFFNNFNRLGNIYFVEEIDNMKGLKQIDNLLFTHTTRDDGTSNGVIQLFNHPMPITEALRRKLQAISRFYGSCIENIEEKTKKITATLSVQLEPGDNDRWLDASMKAVEVAKRQYVDLLMPIERMEDALMKNANQNEQIMAGTIKFDDTDDEREDALDEL